MTKRRIDPWHLTPTSRERIARALRTTGHKPHARARSSPASAAQGQTLAIARARAAAPSLAPLAEFTISSMPPHVLASRNLKSPEPSSRRMELHDAITCPWISYNNNQFINALVFDIDHPHATEDVDAFMQYLRSVDPEAPYPTIVAEPYTGKAHVTWWLQRAVGTDKMPQKIRGLLEVTQCGIIAALHADRSYSNRLTKNPFARGSAKRQTGSKPAVPAIWQAYKATPARKRLRFITTPGDCRTVSLLTLRHAVDAWHEDTGNAIPKPWHWENRKATQVATPRDSDHGSRIFWATWPVTHRENITEWQLIHDLIDLNIRTRFPQCPLKPREVERMARRWASYNRRHPYREPIHSRRTRTVLSPEQIRQRQSQAATHTAQARTATTHVRLQQAERHLTSQGITPTADRLAYKAGVSPSTVKRWRRESTKRPLGVGAYRD